MEYANDEGHYSNAVDETIRDGMFRWDVYGGLRPEDSERALQALSMGLESMDVEDFRRLAKYSFVES